MKKTGNSFSIFISFSLLLLAGGLAILPWQGAAQEIGAWETAANGGGTGTNWAATSSIWLTNTGSGYVTPSGNTAGVSYPDNNTTPITILTGAYVTNSAALTANQLILQSGATLGINSGITVIRSNTVPYDWDISGNLAITAGGSGSINLSAGAVLAVENGGTVTNFTGTTGDDFENYVSTNVLFLNGSLYVITGSKAAGSGSTIPLAAWSPNSTLLYAPGVAGSKFPSQFAGQTFGNFVWNWPLQTSGSLKPSTQGNVNINGTLAIESADGDVIEDIPGSTFALNVGNLLLTNVLFYPTASSGTVIINITGNFIVDSTATFKNNNSSANGNITFDGTSPQLLAFYGVNGSQSAWNWIISAGSTVELGTNLNVSPGSAGAGSVTNNGWLDLESWTLNDSTNLSGSGVISNSVGSASLVGASGSYSGIIVGGTGVISVEKSGLPTWTLTGVNTYSGSTTVGAGTLALTGSASIADSTNILINGGATFDVSGLSSTFTLGAAQALGNNSSNTAAINGSVNAGSGTISLTYTSGTPSIVISGGNLNLASSTVFKVYNPGLALTAGTNMIITNSSSGSVTSTGPLPSVTVGGNGLAAGMSASLQLSSGALDLVVASSTPSVPTITGINISGATLTISATNGADNGQYVLLESTNLLLPINQWTPVLTNNFNSGGGFTLSTNVVNPAIPLEFYILQ